MTLTAPCQSMSQTCSCCIWWWPLETVLNTSTQSCSLWPACCSHFSHYGYPCCGPTVSWDKKLDFSPSLLSNRGQQKLLNLQSCTLYFLTFPWLSLHVDKRICCLSSSCLFVWLELKNPWILTQKMYFSSPISSTYPPKTQGSNILSLQFPHLFKIKWW